MSDLGGGVIWRPDDEHAPNGVPTCPHCAETGRATRVDDPNGRWFCSCGSLFNGGDREWHSLAAHRREAAERRARRQREEAS